MQASRLARLIASLALSAALGAQAQVSADDPVLAENGPVKVYRSDYEAELMKVPADIRPGFANNQKRINELLTRLLVQKSLAAQPQTAALARDPQTAVRIRLEAERVLAQLRLEDIEKRAGAEFDARRSQMEGRARELYLAERARFALPERISASHILIDAKKHTREEGRRLADAARARVIAGEDFNKVAKEVSEDPSTASNEGRLGYFMRAEMDPAFADAAFALRNGEVSEPVLSSFGWHVIKLTDRKPAVQRSFDEVRDLVYAEMRKRYIDEQREAAIAVVRDDPHVKINRDAVDALYVRPGDAGAAASAAAGAPADSANAPGGAAAGAPVPGNATPRKPGTPPPGLTGGAGSR
jgi:parvulin-like peptidyl-prolyl isomerase